MMNSFFIRVYVRIVEGMRSRREPVKVDKEVINVQ